MRQDKLKFVFAVHNHQPVGNFDGVVRECYESAYLPFLDVMQRHPRIRFSLHISGYLLEWLTGGGKTALGLICKMVKRGQIEILTGAYYEAVIPLISEYDAVNSITAYTDKLIDTFGEAPRGMWLAERVYEPHLPMTLKKAGVEYIALDDWHFKTAGIPEVELDRPWVAREGCYEISVFPISKRMRYLVPFGDVADVVAFLRERYDAGDAMVCLADDGEKFGGWPGTNERCYRDGWLEDFLVALDDVNDWLEVSTLGSAYDTLPESGPANLPNASYFEMGRWALPPEDQITLEQLGDDFDGDGGMGHLTPGAPFRSFLNKYPEINYLHKRMTQVSSRLAELEEGGSVYPSIRRSLWRGQANDAYWHGVFGGLYLPHLRRALYQNILATESAIYDELGVSTITETYDFDGDGSPEITMKNGDLLAVFAPDEGLTVKELSDLNAGLCFTDTLIRRFEPYHYDLTAEGNDDGVNTVHANMGAKTNGLDEFLVYDKFPKRLFNDVFPPDDLNAAAYFSGDYSPDTGPGTGVFTCEETTITCEVRFLGINGEPAISALKTITLNEDGVSVSWSGEAASGGRFGCELSLDFWSPDAEHSCLIHNEIEYPLYGPGTLDSLNQFGLLDRLAGWEMVIGSDREMSLWYYPIYTVSRSEGGYEKVFQGVTFFPGVLLNAGENLEWGLKLRIKG
ncbi:MAG: DUF1926 domain-containing protein [bacterium]|nr:DUF1926 domain-containing protein [bacterium]